MTPGIDGINLDGMGMERIMAIIAQIRNHTYQPTPVKRLYIPKRMGSCDR